MEEQLGGVSAWRILGALVPRIRGPKLVEYLIVVGVIALCVQTSLRIFNKTMSNKTKAHIVSVSSTDSDCVGGLCTVQVVEEGAAPKTP